MFNKELIKRYKDPHNVKSREVTKDDTDRVKQEAEVLRKLCFMPVGIKRGGLAIAHQQITNKDPLRFFVTQTGNIIVNPVITRHTKYTIDSTEGCLTFPENEDTVVERYNKCEVEYEDIDNLGVKIKEYLSGVKSKIFQHEIDHFECKYIY